MNLLWLKDAWIPEELEVALEVDLVVPTKPQVVQKLQVSLLGLHASRPLLVDGDRQQFSQYMSGIGDVLLRDLDCFLSPCLILLYLAVESRHGLPVLALYPRQSDVLELLLELSVQVVNVAVSEAERLLARGELRICGSWCLASVVLVIEADLAVGLAHLLFLGLPPDEVFEGLALREVRISLV